MKTLYSIVVLISVSISACSPPNDEPKSSSLSEQKTVQTEINQEVNRVLQILSQDVITVSINSSTPLPIYFSSDDAVDIQVSGEHANAIRVKDQSLYLEQANIVGDQLRFDVTLTNGETQVTKRQVILLQPVELFEKSYEKANRNWGDVVFYKTERAVKACFPSINKLNTDEPFYLDYLDVFITQEETVSVSEYTAHGITINDNTFCLTNLGFGVSYKALFKTGFPFLQGDARADVFKSFTTPDMSPSLSLSGNAYVLPIYVDAQIPIDIVNLERIEIIVLRDSIEQVREKFEDNDFNEVEDYYYLNSIKNNSDVISQETIDITPQINTKVTYKYDISSVLNEHSPGAYTVIAIPKLADAPYRWDSMQMRSVIYTDIALVATNTFEGVYVSAMSYETAQPITGLDIELVAKNAEVIHIEKTNDEGDVFFPLAKINGQGALSAKHIRAIRGKEIGLIDLHFNELDLSVHDIAGVDSVKPIDIFLFSDRGVYRNAETISINGIIRERIRTTDFDYPVVVKIRKPDGDVITSQAVTVSENGLFQWNYTIPKSERTGQWSVDAHIGESKQPIATHLFLVADYVPETIESFVTIDDTIYENEALDVNVKADYLYGAPASGLTVEGYVQFSKDRRPFNKYSQYLFGTDKSFNSIRKNLPNTKLDAEGKQRLIVPANVITESMTKESLKGKIHIAVTEDSGRKNRSAESIRAMLLPSYVGVKAKSSFGYYPIDSTLDLSIVNLNHLGEAIENNSIRYRIMEVDWDYHWYRSNGYWEYMIHKRDVTLADENTVTTDATGKAYIPFKPENWKRYRLELIDSNSGHETHYAFRSGWSNTESQFASPQDVDISLDKSSYTLGETIRVNITPPYKGRLKLSVANQTYYDASWHEVSNEQLYIELPVQKAWQEQVYITATVYRPGNKDNGATRAVGVEHVKIEQPQLSADITLLVTEKTRPQQTLEIGIESDLSPAGEVLFFAVDQGILNLTNYKTPKPLSYFLRKQAYPNKIYDLYQYLIQYKNGELLEQNVGGDSANEDSADRFFEPVVYFSEPVRVDANGYAKTSFTLPYYNGRLKVFALGVDEKKMGHVSSSTIVSSPITLDAITPRFAHVNDRFELGLTLNNIEYGTSDIDILWSTTDGLELQKRQSRFILEQKDKRQEFVKLTAKNIGQQHVTAQVSVDGKAYQTFTFNIKVINQRPEMYQSSSISVLPKQSSTVNFDTSHLIEPNIDFSLTSHQDFGNDEHVNTLLRYPLSCLEQTTSKAWAFLYNGKVINDNKKLSLIKGAIEHIDSMKLSNNAYSLWPNGYSAEPWLTVYASEFILHAFKEYKDSFMDLTGELVERVRWAKSYSGGDSSIKIYSLYFLAEVNPGFVDLGDLRYTTQLVLKNLNKYSIQDISLLMLANDRVDFTDNVMQLYTALSDKQLGPLDKWSRHGYDSEIKAHTIKAFSILEANNLNIKQKEKAQTAINTLHEVLAKDSYLSTHERAWLVRLNNTLAQSQYSEILENTRIDGEPIDSDTVRSVLQKNSSFNVTNTSANVVYFNLSASGRSEQPLNAYANNLGLSTRYLNVNNANEIKLDNIQTGDELIVEHTITLQSEYDTELSIVAPVPAGFEIEDPKLSSLRDLGASASHPPTYTEYRDDKFLAAWSLPRGKNSTENGKLIIRYVVIAVTKGEFTQSSVVVEDMYRTANRAMSGESSIVIR